jgi:hypothetical protein
MARDRQRHFFWRKLQAGDGGGEGKNKNGLPVVFFFGRMKSGSKKLRIKRVKSLESITCQPRDPDQIS